MAAGEVAGQPAASLSTDTASRLVKRSPWNAPAPPRSPLPPTPPTPAPILPLRLALRRRPQQPRGCSAGGGCLAGVSRPHRPWPHPWCGAPLRSPGAQPRDRVLARLLHVDAASVGLTVSLHVVLPPLVRRRHAAPHPTWGGGGHESSRAAGGVEVEQQGAEPSVGSVGSVSSSPARRQEPSVLFSRRPLRWEGTRPFQAQAAEAAEVLSTERPILRRLALLRL